MGDGSDLSSVLEALAAKFFHLAQHMHGSGGGGDSARDLSGVYIQFKVSAFSNSLFGFPFTLGSPAYAGLLPLFFIYQKDDLSVEFLKYLCCCRDDYTVFGQSCKQKQTTESQRTHSKHVTAPYSLPVLVQYPKTVIDVFFFLLSRVYSSSL